MALKVYGHRVSQPSRAVMIFCKLNGIEFEEVTLDLPKKQHKSPEFKEINPLGQVPAIVHDDFKLFESHAILTYLASAFPGVADHWYPTDLRKRAKVQSVLDWHHSTLRRGSAPVFGLPLNPQAAAEGEKALTCALTTIESIWLQDGGDFLLGGSQPSLADLSLVCEIMQLHLLDENDRNRLLGPFKKVQRWVEKVKNATNPHFDEYHGALFQFSAMLNKPQ